MRDSKYAEGGEYAQTADPAKIGIASESQDQGSQRRTQ